MNPSQPAQRAIEMLEAQVTDLAGIRNATARDPSFKNWRQATLTVMQRVWPGDQTRSERFRRIPFSPVDPRADLRAVREQYSRGCQEAGRVLTGFIAEIREHGVPELSDTAAPHAPESDFEDGFPTLDLPSGDIATHAATQAEPAQPAENLLPGVGDEPPQGKDPDFADPARLPNAPPAAAAATTMANMVAQGVAKRGPSMKSRLRDLLGFAHLSAKSLAGFPRDSASEHPAAAAPPMLPAAEGAPEPLGMVPFGEDLAAIAPVPAAPQPPAPTARSVSAAASDVPADWPVIPRRASADASPPSEQAPWPASLAPGEPLPANSMPVPAAPAASPVAPPQAAVAPVPGADEPRAPLTERAQQESTSVIMSKPTTLRANIEKVSIESLISAEFRATSPGDEPGAGSEPRPATDAHGPDVNAAAPSASVPALPTPVAAVPAAGPRPVPGADGPVRGSKSGARPALSLVRPLADDPEFNVDPTPSRELPAPAGHTPVSALTPKPARGAAARLRAVPPPAKPPVQEPALPSADADLVDEPEADVDPDAFARATEDFMRSSPVLGASPRRSQRMNDDPGFGDPDAIAVSSMALELSRMEVPQERHAEVRARLMDLARRLERGELEWNALRKAVWFAMEHPELARRLMPVLLPWIDRAA